MNHNPVTIIDLFAGGGGFSAGVKMARPEAAEIAYELDGDAVATLRANGVTTVRADLTTEPTPYPFEDCHAHLHASPPCQSFSVAGKGRGRGALDQLGTAVRRILLSGEQPDLRHLDINTQLSAAPARWIAELMPQTISFEQVRGVLPLWEVYAEALEQLGYSVWTGVLHAEQYGVPQTRTRAILLASRVGEVRAPVPTHSKYHSRSPERLDEGVLPWVSMAEALGWGDGQVGFARKADGRGEVVEIDGEQYRARDLRDIDQPAFNLTEKARSWTHYRQSREKRATVRQTDQPAPTVKFGHAAADARFTTDPADLDAPQYGPNARQITVAEAAALQTFPPDWEFVGSKTSQFRQIGNAVPSLLVGPILDAVGVPK